MGATQLPLVALTAGEPAGIGPDLCALLAREKFPGRIVIVGDREVIARRAAMRSIAFDAPRYEGRDSAPVVSLLHLPVTNRVVPGQLDKGNASDVLGMLDRAIDRCMRQSRFIGGESKSTSAGRRSPRLGVKQWGCRVLFPPTRFSRRASSPKATWRSPCSTTRGSRCSSTRHSGKPST